MKIYAPLTLIALGSAVQPDDDDTLLLQAKVQAQGRPQKDFANDQLESLEKLRSANMAKLQAHIVEDVLADLDDLPKAPPNPPLPTCEERMAVLDGNKDGVINLDEWEHAVRVTTEDPDLHPESDFYFKKWDEDEDGMITKKEWTGFCHQKTKELLLQNGFLNSLKKGHMDAATAEKGTDLAEGTHNDAVNFITSHMEGLLQLEEGHGVSRVALVQQFWDRVQDGQVELLQHMREAHGVANAAKAATQLEGSCVTAGNSGDPDHLITFGAPAVSNTAMEDYCTGGSFKGYRVFGSAKYVEDYRQWGWCDCGWWCSYPCYSNRQRATDHILNDVVSWLADVVNYHHPKMQAVQINKGSVSGSLGTYSDGRPIYGSTDTQWPPATLSIPDILATAGSALLSAGLNFIGISYTSDNVKKLGQGVATHVEYDKSTDHAHTLGLTNLQDRATYHWVEDIYHVTKWGEASSTTWASGQSASRGYRLIGHLKVGAVGDHAGDVAALHQKTSTLDCVLSFKGSDGNFEVMDTYLDWLNNLNFIPRNYCGRGGVHQGFINELNGLVGNSNWESEIQNKLKYCNKIHISGHSLGGAQANLAFFCMKNRQASSDYNKFKFTKATPALQSVTSGVTVCESGKSCNTR